jgi:hypothetical protein
MKVDEIRRAHAADDDAIAAVVSEWWERDMVTFTLRLAE